MLALGADAQIGWLGENGPPLVDELALEFDDGFRLVPTFIERGWLNPTALPVLAEIDQHLSSMSGEHNAGLWLSADPRVGRVDCSDIE